jgi:uncharacterized protein (DUF2384 family)
MTTDFVTTSEFTQLRNKVIETFGSESLADQWLYTFNVSLSGTPLSISQTPTGLLEVQKVLNAISYGGVI